MIFIHFIPKSYVLKNKILKSDNNKRILAPNDNNKKHFLCSNLMSWQGLYVLMVYCVLENNAFKLFLKENIFYSHAWFLIFVLVVIHGKLF